MQIILLPSSFPHPGEEPTLTLTSYLVNDAFAIDAGALGLFGSPDAQSRIRHVFLSHTHADHLATLPIFVENAAAGRTEPVVLHASAAVLDGLRQHVFNDRIWPNFLALPSPDAPFLRLAELRPGEPVDVEGVRVTPVPVNHVVPTMGFLLDDGTAAVVIASDTGPTEEIWERARALPHLKAVFLEATFPNAMTRMADLSKHLTPATFAGEVRKLGRAVRVVAVHIKPRFRAEVVAELHALGLPQLEIAEPGRAYVF